MFDKDSYSNGLSGMEITCFLVGCLVSYFLATCLASYFLGIDTAGCYIYGALYESTSCRIIRPFGPEPDTYSKLIPLYPAAVRAAGLAIMLLFFDRFTDLVGGGVF